MFKNNYFIDLSVPLTNIERETLFFVYQPVIGFAALSIYNFLIEQNKIINSSEKISKIELLEFLNLNEEILVENFKILKKYNLLTIIDFDVDTIIIKLKNPSLIIKLLKDYDFYNDLFSKINKKTFEKIYLRLINSFSKEKELILNEKIELNIMSIQTEYMKTLKYELKLKEYNFFRKLIIKFHIPEESLKLIIDYVLFKNSGKRIEINYVSKIIEDFYYKKILEKPLELKKYFIGIFDNMSVSKSICNLIKRPKWLNDIDVFKFTPNIKKKEKKEIESNNNLKDFSFKIIDWF